MYSSSNTRALHCHSLPHASASHYTVHVPDAVRTLENVLKSREALIHLIQRFGGCTLRIPMRRSMHGKKSQENHPLSLVLTPKQMENIISYYGGTDLYVPKCQKYVQYLRNSSIIQVFCEETQKGVSSGKMVQNLAQKYGLSDRRIWSILKMGIPSPL